MPDEFGITPEDPAVEGEEVDARAFPPGARVLLTDTSLVQLADGSIVPASDYDDVPEAVEENAGGFVQVDGHGWSDEALAERAANEAAGVQGERVSADNPANRSLLPPGQAINIATAGDPLVVGSIAEVQALDGQPTLVAVAPPTSPLVGMTSGVQASVWTTPEPEAAPSEDDPQT